MVLSVSIATAAQAETSPTAAGDGPAITAEQEEFFEARVRPVLAENCLRCHGPDKQRGGLRLDSMAAMLNGTESGPAVVPGEPEKSPLIAAVRYSGDIQMPPAGKLPDHEIEALTRWVRLGAPWPTSAVPSSVPASGPTREEQLDQIRRTHWAFQPVELPLIPHVRQQDWIATPVDAFVLSSLERAGLHPAPPADRRMLIRRATYDLTGLPPSADEVEQFERDESLDAYERLVDRLLASPRYGERWARHWLDVARYADTKGYVFNEERRFPYSYTYRDYVIRAFNEDLPYDQFVVQQLAADQLELGEDNRALAAMGFLTLGRRFTNVIHDIIDDRIDVVTRGFLGLTVSCARCHDHKYDPIPTEDYYSLYGVFASSVEPKEAPLIGMVQETAAYTAHMKELETHKKTLETFTSEKHAALTDALRSQVGTYLAESLEPARPEVQEFMLVYAAGEIRPPVVDRWREFIRKSAGSHHPVFAPWHALSRLKAKQFKHDAQRTLFTFATAADAPKTAAAVNPLILEALRAQPLESMADVARVYGQVLGNVHAKWQAARKASTQPADAKPLEKLPEPAEEELRQVLYGPGTPTVLAPEDAAALFDHKDNEKWGKLKRKVDGLQANAMVAPPRAQVVVDAAAVQEPRVFIRGHPGNPGKLVRRQFLHVLAGDDRQPFTQGSGRLELARAIATRDNPLTARVMVNRIWLHHFGAGLVRTPSDFGIRGEPPTHPELLDYLAYRFVEDGWSIKKLHRLIMLSSTYRQSSLADTGPAQLDPDNRLLWRANRRRLDFESLRDSLLAVSAGLDLAEGGPAVEITQPPFSRRRSIYGFIERQNLPAVFRTFDFASPDTHSPFRHVTTVPQQGLFLLNSPFVIEQARRLAARPEIARIASPYQRVEALHRIVLGRPATSEEVALGVRFASEPGGPEPGPRPEPVVWQQGYGFYDARDQVLRSFTPLPHFAEGRWQGGPKLPDQRLGWVMLSAVGGHVGNDAEHAAIRRWTAPVAGAFNIRGVLEHPEQRGDGVQAWIVSSRTGARGHGVAHGSKAETRVWRLELEAGDQLCFIVNGRGNPSHDTFSWAPIIETAVSETVLAGGTGEQRQASATASWDAQADFRGPPPEPPAPLERWEQYAQVLLLTNEFMFVD
ncbi:MAG: hypothetical protein AMXMBFR13_08950 [Phycisphaerae bacterium]